MALKDLFKKKTKNKQASTSKNTTANISSPTDFQHLNSGNPFNNIQDTEKQNIEDLPTIADVKQELETTVSNIENVLTRGYTFITKMENTVKEVGSEVLDGAGVVLEKTEDGIDFLQNSLTEAKSVIEALQSELKNTQETLNSVTDGYTVASNGLSNLQAKNSKVVAENESLKKNLDSEKNQHSIAKKALTSISGTQEENGKLKQGILQKDKIIEKHSKVLAQNKSVLDVMTSSTNIALITSITLAVIGGITKIPFIANAIKQYPIISTLFSLIGLGGLGGATAITAVKASAYDKNKKAQAASQDLSTDMAGQKQEQAIGV